MSFYAISTRNHKNRNGDKFGSEPDAATYLIAPDDADSFRPSHARWGRRREAGRRWVKAIQEEALARAAAKPPSPDGRECLGDIIVFVHGFNVDAQGTFERHRAFVNHYATNNHGLEHAVFVSYDWPAQGDIWNYLEDGFDARKTALQLVESGLKLFAAFSEPGCKIRVHVLGHSMGALVIREALRTAPDYRATRDRAWSFNQLVLAGADISRASFDSREGWAMRHYSQRVTNYFNRHDKALATSNVKRVMTSPRLGRHGAPESLWEEIADVDASARWIEVTRTNQDGFIAEMPQSHGFYFDDPVWLEDFARTILGDDDRRSIPTREPHPEYPGRLLLKAKR